MVGDYESISWVRGHAVTVFALASAPVGLKLDEAEYAATFPLSSTETSLTSAAGSGQIARISKRFSSRLDVLVSNPATGAPVAGAKVTFRSPATGSSATFGGKVRSVTTTSNALGIASVLPTANGIEGTFVITATAKGHAGSAHFSLLNAGTPVSITPVALVAPEATGTGTAFPRRLAVIVRDADGTIVPGATVIFTAPTSGASGTFSAPGNGRIASVVTGRTGTALAPTFKANSVRGAYTVTVKVSNPKAPSARVELANTAGGPATIVITGGNHQSTPAGSAFASALSVRVTDGAGRPIPGTAVTFRAPAALDSATFLGSGTNVVTILTNAAGVAIVLTTYAGSVAGAYSVTVTDRSASNSLTLTNTP
jgi:hypothetical protein